MLRLNQLRAPAGATKKRKRIGRGAGSGHGGRATRGQKGQKSRSGGKIHPWFEGGQMPLLRRLPKVGFKSPAREEFQIVNVGSLEKCSGQESIVPLVLKNAGLVKYADRPIKILGQGDLKTAFTVQVHAYSKSAQKKIEAAGGKAEFIR